MFGYAWASRGRPPGKPALYAAIFILAGANIAYVTTTKPTTTTTTTKRRRRVAGGAGDSRVGGFHDDADADADGDGGDDDVVALRKEARRRRSLALFKRQNPDVGVGGDDE